MADERLLDFPPLASPTPSDIVYVGDASDGYNEVKSTIAQIIGAYPSLLSMGGQSIGADQMLYCTATDTFGVTSLTAFARTLLADNSAGSAQATLGLLIGTDVEAWSAALDSIAGLTTAANKMIYTTALNTYAVTDLTAFARTLLDDTDAATAAATLAVLPLAGGTMSGQINMGSQRIVSMADPVNPQDAVTLNYLTSGGVFLPLSGGTMTGVINMGSHKITNVTDPTLNQDAATKFYIDNLLTNYLPLAGGTMASTTGVINMNSSKITGLATCTNSGDAANKAYVDSVATGLTVQEAVYAATTGALTATYANGAAGIGATLTNSGALAAFSTDGVSPPINSRILVKNQGTTFQNGIYTLTTVGSGAVAWVLTRATDYDQPSEIQPGDLVIVNNGTANAGSSFIETATVTTIGTDAILFSQFTFSASSVLLKANNLSDVSSVTTAFGNISPLTTKGDILTYSTLNARLAVGSTNGQILQVNSGAATGLAWSTCTYPSSAGAAGKILVSNGTNYVDSTPKFPNASATARKMIVSDGTDWVASTETWAVPGASGTLLQSNGTNWISSTATYPSTAGAAGKMLVSNGTNYVDSTPTFPNASATSGKIIKSDGTNWIASTETYAAPGTSGNVMKSDGTNWTSAAPGVTYSYVKQVVQTVDTTNRSTSSASYVTTNITVSITPSANTNRVRLYFYGLAGQSTAATISEYTLYRDSTPLTPSGVNSMGASYMVTSNAGYQMFSLDFIDSPATTSAITYSLYFRTTGGTSYLGRRGADTTIDNCCVLTAEEISA